VIKTSDTCRSVGGMNDRLREAITESGAGYSDIAAELHVAPRSVERWVTGVTPYSRHRVAVAAYLGVDETELWPDVQPASASRLDLAAAEVVTVYPARSLVPAGLWANLFDRARYRIDVLVYAGLFFPEARPGLAAELAAKATEGVQVRMCLGDPKSRAVARRGREEGIGGAMAAKIENALAFYRPHVGAIGVRLHATPLYNSLYRFDNDLLVNTHLLGSAAAHNPVIHLRQIDGGEMFRRHLEVFDTIWHNARPAWANEPEEVTRSGDED
jgi:hypothetical protein